MLTVRDEIIAKAYELSRLISKSFPEWKDKYCARFIVCMIIGGYEPEYADIEHVFRQLKISEGG